MPRREQIDEKKKERLKQENDVLQSLMLKSRSSVRPSSLKNHSAENLLQQENDPVEMQTPQRTENTLQANEIPSTHTSVPETRTALTQEERTPDVELPKERLTATATHQKDQEVTQRPLPQKNKTINVILPVQKSATPVPEPEVTPAEPVRRTHNALIVEKDMFHKERGGHITAEQPVSRKAKRNTPKTKPLKALSYTVLMLLGLLVGFGGYYFYAKYGSRTARSTKRTADVASTPVTQTLEESGNEEPTTESEPAEGASQPADTRIANKAGARWKMHQPNPLQLPQMTAAQHRKGRNQTQPSAGIK
jgi:hypothetical protein